MRVLTVTNMWPSGTDRAFGVFVRDQVESLRSLGVDVDVEFINGRADRLEYLRAIGRVRAAVRRGPYDLVHAHYVLSGIVALARGRFPLVLTHHGIEVTRGWQAPLCRFATRRADGTIVANRTMKRALGDDTIRVIPCGVDRELFRPMPMDEARDRLGIPQDGEVVLFAGIDRPEKRLDIAREAVAILRRRGRDVRLLVSGGARPREEIPLLMNACNAVVLTSVEEGSPMAIKEAMACERPIVSTPVGDVPELLASSSGCCLARGDPGAVADGLERALAWEGPTGGRAATVHLSLEATAARVLAVYEEVVARRPPARPRRVAVVRHGNYPEDPRVRREVGALMEAGHQVDVFCLRRPGQAARERCGGASVHRLPVRHLRGGRLRYLFEYGAFLFLAAAHVGVRSVRRRYDLVQVHSMPDCLVFAALVPRLQGVPVLLDLHEVIPELYRSKYGARAGHAAVRALEVVERVSARFATHVLTVSEPTRDLLVGRSVDPARLSVVMNVADEGLFDRIRLGADDGECGEAPAAGHGASARAPFTIVSHGTLAARYGVDVAIRAMARVVETDPHVRLLIAGEGDHEPALRELAGALRLGGAVTFLGFRPLDEVATILARADAGIVSGRPDVFMDLVLPTKLLEMVVLRVPAIVARNPTVSRYFADDELHYFDPGDAEDLARVIRRVAADPVRARAVAEEAGDRFARAHGWAATRDVYRSVVDGLIGASAPRSCG